MQIDISGVKNPRKREYQAKYPFYDMLIIILLASLSGAESACEMEDYAKEKVNLLNNFLTKPNQTPSHDTFSKILRVVDPDQLEKLLSPQISNIREIAGKIIENPQLAVDGKTLNHSCEGKDKHKPPMTVSAFATESSLVVGFKSVPDRKENKAIENLLQHLDIKGCIITADALHCYPTTIEIINAKEGQYCISAKRNQLNLIKAFEEEVLIKVPISKYEQEDKNKHGRTESRSVKVYSFNNPKLCKKWAGLSGFATIDNVRIEHDKFAGDKTTTNKRYYILSNLWSAEKVHNLARNHWRIETSLHGILDIDLGEDASRSRKDNAPQNIAILKRITMNIIKLFKSKISLRRIRKSAGWNDDFLIKLISFYRP